MRRTEQARIAYNKNPSIETADQVMAAIDRAIIRKQRDPEEP